MFCKIKKKTGQSTLEYSVLALLIIGSLVAMKTYLERGIQGKLKSSTDDISSEQFDPTLTVYNKKTVTDSKTKETLLAGQTNTVLRADEITNVDINSTTGTISGGGTPGGELPNPGSGNIGNIE